MARDSRSGRQRPHRERTRETLNPEPQGETPTGSEGEETMQVVRGKVPRKVVDMRPIISKPGMFDWVRDVARAYVKDLRTGQRNSWRTKE